MPQCLKQTRFCPLLRAVGTIFEKQTYCFCCASFFKVYFCCFFKSTTALQESHSGNFGFYWCLNIGQGLNNFCASQRPLQLLAHTTVELTSTHVSAYSQTWSEYQAAWFDFDKICLVIRIFSLVLQNSSIRNSSSRGNIPPIWYIQDTQYSTSFPRLVTAMISTPLLVEYSLRTLKREPSMKAIGDLAKCATS